MLLNYQASGGSFKEEASYNGADELGDPVEEASENGDLTSKSQSEGDGGVDVATGDVGAYSDRHKESKAMANCYGHKPRWIKSRIGCHLVCKNYQTTQNKNKNKTSKSEEDVENRSFTITELNISTKVTRIIYLIHKKKEFKFVIAFKNKVIYLMW